MSRKKSKIQYDDKANPMYILTAQKKELKDAVFPYLEMFAIWLGLLIMCVVITCMIEWTDFSYVYLSIIVFLSIAMVVCAFKFIRTFSILRALNRIRSESGETVKIECKDVRFITYYFSRVVGILTIAIIFVGTNHKKYVYVLPHYSGLDKKTRQHIIDKCLFENVELTCYNGTRMIKEFDIWDEYK